MPIEIADDFKTRVPPSLNENVVEARGFETDEFVLAAQNVLRMGRTAAEAARQAAQAHLLNEMATLPARHRAARDAVFGITKGAVQRFDSEGKRLNDKIAALTEHLRGPRIKADAYSQLAAMEIRTGLANLPRDQRRATIIAAIKSGDQAVAGAVLRGPAFLSALTEIEVEDFRLQWQQVNAPAEASRLAMLRKVEEHLSRGGRLLLDHSLKLFDSALIERAEKHERRAADVSAAATA